MKHFKLHANCIPVKGAKESIIVDLQNFAFYEIPNLLFDILQLTKTKNIAAIKTHFSNQYDEGIDAYFNQFIELNLGFILNEFDTLAEFPELSMDWSTPYMCQAAVFEIDANNRYDYLSIFQELIAIQLPSALFYFVNTCTLDDLNGISEALDQSTIKTCDIYLPFEHKDQHMLTAFLSNHHRIRRLVLHNAPQNFDTSSFYEQYPLKDKIVITSKDINPQKYEDDISIENFKFLQTYFAEAHTKNVALNRKITFDKDGNIKNFLSHQLNFGNVKTDHWRKIYLSESFQKRWHVTNDEIVKCKDCQFRYGCFSNSDLVLNQENEWEKSQLCTFNPYTNEWS